jgi:hypothetical protein
MASTLQKEEAAPPAPAPAPAVAEPKKAAVVRAKATREEPAPAPYVPPSRANKTGRTHHLPPAYWQTLEELSFRSRDEKGKRVPQERLVAEALNLLFAKHNYPLVRDE